VYPLVMSEKPPLNDSEVYDRLHEAWLAVQGRTGETTHGDTALKVARTMLVTLQGAVLKKMDATDPDETLALPPSDQL
jgi:hypothetical protein